MWLKIWRDSSAMAGKPHYAEYEKDEDIDQILEYYDDMIHSDGYHDLKWEKIVLPPNAWLLKQLSKYSEILENLYAKYKQDEINLIKTVEHYKHLIALGY